MSIALASLAALAALTGDLEGELSGRLLVVGGVSPIDARNPEVGQVSLELTPRGSLRYLEGATTVDLVYSPRFYQRFILEPVGAATERPDLEPPTQFHQGDVTLSWRPARNLSLRGSLGGGLGVVGFADSFSTGSTDATDRSVTIANVSGNLGLTAVVVPRGDTFRLGGEVASNFTLDEGLGATARDRTRLFASSAYLWQPSPLDGFEAAVSAELSVYPSDDGVGVPQGPRAAVEQSGFSGATVGWVRRLSRRGTCSLRAGVVLLFNRDLGVVPSALVDCSFVTLQSPGVRMTTTLSGGIVGGTSSVDAVAEPRASAGLNLRFVIVPDKGLGLTVAYSWPIPAEENQIPSPASLLASVPFGWQLSPGVDLELGARFGMRGVIDPGQVIAPGGSPFGNFGDTIDVQIFAGLAVQLETGGESRYQR